MAPAALTDPLTIGTLRLKNRLYRAPLLEGAGVSRDPVGEYLHQFLPNARAGVGMIIQGTVCVLPEGRPSPGMTAVEGPEDLLQLRPVTQALRAEGVPLVLQLGHGGMYCVESWNKRHVERRRSLPVAVSSPPPLPRLIAGPVHVMSTRDVEGLVDRFGQVAGWAREAGYDALQLSSSNGKLLQQFLSRVTNRRTDRYGGDLEGRTTFMREVREAIAREAGADFPVMLKYCALEHSWTGGGITLEEGVEIGRIAERVGFAALTPVATHASPSPAFCRGDYPAATFKNKRLDAQIREAMGHPLRYWVMRLGLWAIARRYPFEAVWNRAVFSAVKEAVSLPVFAVGGIRTPHEAADILGRGQADLIGVGRPFYIDPDLPRAFLASAGRGDHTALLCNSCNRCALPQLLGSPGVCYNPAMHKARKGADAGAAARALAA